MEAEFLVASGSCDSYGAAKTLRIIYPTCETETAVLPTLRLRHQRQPRHGRFLKINVFRARDAGLVRGWDSENGIL